MKILLSEHFKDPVLMLEPECDSERSQLRELFIVLKRKNINLYNIGARYDGTNGINIGLFDNQAIRQSQ